MGLEVENGLGVLKFGRRMVLRRLQGVPHVLSSAHRVDSAAWEDWIWHQRGMCASREGPKRLVAAQGRTVKLRLHH